jgi:O-Antigen ligase
VKGVRVADRGSYQAQPGSVPLPASKVGQNPRWSSWLAVAAGPVVAGGRQPLAWASWVLAALSAGYIAWTIASPAGVLAAIALPLLVLRLPVAGIAVIAIVAEEISPSGQYGWVTTLGSQVFLSAGKAPIILPLVLTAAVAATARWWPAKSIRTGWLDLTLIGSVGALVVLTIGVGLGDGQSVFSAVNQNARPFILLGLGIVVGFSLRRLPEERTPLMVAAAVGLVALLVAAAFAIPTGGSADARLSRYFIFYDSALPAFAAAVFLALLTDRTRRWDWRHLVLLTATPLLVLISFRRSVWLAAALVLVVVVALGWTRWRMIVSRGGLAVAVVAVAVLAAPGFAADIGQRGAATLPVSADPPAVKPSATASPASGGGGVTPAAGNPAPAPSTVARPAPSDSQKVAEQAASTTGHAQDLRRGWDHVRAHFWTGVGPVAPQLPGLAAKNASRVYVHNELLQDWLRYGPFGALLMAILLAAAALIAARTLRDPGGDTISRTAAVFCLLTPVCVMTAPFLSDTSRWPVLFGLTAGIVMSSARRGERA